jgi:hypothetical protein
VLGGLLVLAVIIVASPNFESVRSYFAAFFVAIFLCAYPSLSSGRVAYAGQQAGVSFVLTYATSTAKADVYDPLWRVWGIFLGLLIVSSVFLLVGARICEQGALGATAGNSSGRATLAPPD